MTLVGETVGTGAPDKCPDCGTLSPLQVLRSAAGYYLGHVCACGPYSRESVAYWRTRDDAQRALDSGAWEPRR